MKPLISISIITYNHAPFIKACLDSVLSQEGNFSIEILIHDDASTDGTQDIIKQYMLMYPKLIFPIFQNENQYSKGERGFMSTYNFPRAKGKYIAFCEGDDLWIDVHKLQMQIDLLETKKDLSGCFSNIIYINKDGVKIGDGEKKIDLVSNEVTFESTVLHMQINTVSVMIRSDRLSPKILEELATFPYGDLPIFLLLMLKNNFGYIDQKLAAYRKEVGVMKTWSKEYAFKSKIEILTRIERENILTTTQAKAIHDTLAKLTMKLARIFKQEKKYISFFQYSFMFLKYSLVR